MAALNSHTGCGNVGNLDGVVFAGADGVCEVQSNLFAIDVESSNEVDVVDVVLAELDVHQTRDRGLGVSVAIVLNTLDQRCGAVTYTDNGNTNRM
ncbi:hypothetical protein D3C73_1170590 [compost metagenome]